jgi:hypothetical protein
LHGLDIPDRTAKRPRGKGFKLIHDLDSFFYEILCFFASLRFVNS